MGFNFATGQIEEDKVPTKVSGAPVQQNSKTPTGTFDFATGKIVGSSPVSDVTKAVNALPAPEPSTPSFLSNFLTPTKINAFSPKVDAKASEIASGIWNTYKQTPNKILDDIKEGAKNLSQGKLSDLVGINTGGFTGGNIGKGVIKTAFRTAADAAEAIFAPISAAIGAALESSGGDKLIDKTGKTIADKNGITDWPLFQKYALEHPNAGEDFNRLLNLVMTKGETGKIEPSTLIKRIQEMSNKLSADTVPVSIKELPVKTTSTENKIPISTPERRYSEYRSKQGYEPYTPPEKLPTIEMGTKPKSDIPSVQIGEEAIKSKSPTGDFKYEPIKEQTPSPADLELLVRQFTKEPKVVTPVTEKAPKIKEKPVISETPTPTVKEKITQPKTTVAPEGAEVPNTRADKLLKAAVEKRLVESIDSEKTTHIQEKTKEWSDKAVEYIKNNPIQYMDVALGLKDAPKGVRPESIYVAAEIKAIKEGDVATILKLKNSTVPTETGRGFKALDSNDPYSPLKIIRDIENARKEKTQKFVGKEKEVAEAKKELITRGKKEVKTTEMKLTEAQSLLESLIC